MNRFLFFLCCVLAVLSSCKKENEPDDSFTQWGTVQGPGEGISSLAVSPDGELLTYGNYSDNLIRIIEVATKREIRNLSGHTKPVTELAFSPNGQLLASSGTVNLPPGIDGMVRLWNVENGNLIASVEMAPAGISQLAFSPDGSLLAGAGGGGNSLSVTLWNANNLSLIRTLTGVFRMAAFSPDGNRLMTAKRDTKVYILETATGNEITSFSGHTGWIQSATYSPDGQHIATGGEDRTIQIRYPQSGQTTLTLPGHTSYPEFLAFSPDGARLASLGSGINITRTSSGGLSMSLSSADKFLRIWNLDTGTELPPLNIETDVVSCAALSADWSVLATGSDSGLIRIFK